MKRYQALLVATALGALGGYIVGDDARIEGVAEQKQMALPLAVDYNRQDEIRQAMEQMGQQIQGARK